MEPARPPGPRPLHSLSMPGYAISAVVPAARPIDSGVRGTVWHRVYLEASLPSGTGVTLRLAAAETPKDAAGAAFFEHVFRDGAPATDPDVPRGAWLPQPSEVPFHPGLLDCPSEPGRTGLFMALVQRAGRVSRELKGRYLKMELVLHAPVRRRR